METYYLHRKSVYLIGRNRLVADVPTDHLSCSGRCLFVRACAEDWKEGGGRGSWGGGEGLGVVE